MIIVLEVQTEDKRYVLNLDPIMDKDMTLEQMLDTIETN